MVIIDYGDILGKDSSINSQYEAYGDVYTGMKAFAKLYKIPVVTASQGNRSSINS
jgi:replicative DNA helicase